MIARINRLRSGLLGDWRLCRDGVAELRVHHGPGYRLYFARMAPDFALLLCGGTKRTQPADITRAVTLLRDYEERG